VNIVRTIMWVFAAFGFLIFAIYNWEPVELRLWQDIRLETKVPMLALLAFTAGFLPMWALHRSVVWGLNRRIRALETSLKNVATARQREAEATTMVAATAGDSAVEKHGKSGGDAVDPLAPVDAGTDGGSDS
jgi:lipopolysaccharide assembly protein A